MEAAYYALANVKGLPSMFMKVAYKPGGIRIQTMLGETTGSVRHVDTTIACRGLVGLVLSAVLVNRFSIPFSSVRRDGHLLIIAFRCPGRTHSTRAFDGHIHSRIRRRSNH